MNLLTSSPHDFVLANPLRFRHCACSSGFADVCRLKSWIACKPTDLDVPSRFWNAENGLRFHPWTLRFVNSFFPIRSLDRRMNRFIRFCSYIGKNSPTPTPTVYKTFPATRDSILEEMECALEIMEGRIE